MDLDVRRKLIIGALDPRHDDVDQASCPGIGTLGTKNREPGLPLRLLRHLVRGSGEPPAGRRLRRASRRPHGQLHRELRLRLDGRARAAQRPRVPRAVHAGRPRRRPADLGHRPQGSGAPGVFPKPIDLWRNDGLTDYSHDVDVDANGIAWVERPRRPARLRDARQLARSADRQDARRQAVGSGARRRRRHRGRAGRRRAAADRLHPQLGRPLDGEVAGVRRRRRQHRADDRGGLHEPCDQGGRIVAADITSSLGGEPAANSTPAQPYRMTRSSAFHPTQDAADTTAPIGSLLGALLRARRARRSRRPGTGRDCG